MPNDLALRQHLTDLLNWPDAHVTFDGAVAKMPVEMRGKTPRGLPYSPWQLLEHLRLAQRDILEFCVMEEYEKKAWPDDYWPKSPKPPSVSAWAKSVAAFKSDRKALIAMVNDSRIDLTGPIPGRNKYTYLREMLLVADHNAYHVGQLIYARRSLGAWHD